MAKETIKINNKEWIQVASAGENISAQCMTGFGCYVILDDAKPGPDVEMTEGYHYKHHQLIGLWNLAHDAYARSYHDEAVFIKQID